MVNDPRPRTEVHSVQTEEPAVAEVRENGNLMPALPQARHLLKPPDVRVLPGMYEEIRLANCLAIFYRHVRLLDAERGHR